MWFVEQDEGKRSSLELGVRIPGGVRGDPATAAVPVHTIPPVLAAETGLRSPLELPLPKVLS